jgi:MazG family protein
MDGLREEIGDMFYHLVMQVQLAVEQQEFRLNEVMGGIISKLIRRHPHVWGDVEVADSGEVIRNWEAIKEQENVQAEKGDSVLDSIPLALPALARAQKIQQRVARIGFDWPDIGGVEAKIVEELDEIRAAQSTMERQMELGDLLFAVVNWLRWLNLDAESVLREANARFERRFRQVELMARSRDLDLAGMSIDELEALWQEAKVVVRQAAGGSVQAAATNEP